MPDAGLCVCVIGRNEGARLRAALSVVRDRGVRRVYVDSASTDDSVEIAQGYAPDVDLVQIPVDEAGTASLGRNRGFEFFEREVGDFEFVQFVDGDCVLADDWLDTALAHMREHPDVGILAGRLREEYRERNVYHRLADMEWDTPTGDVEAVGGICMVRAEVFRAVGGQDAAVAQGEEAEFAQRVRDQGYRVVRLEDDMARHDIAMGEFAAWWRRTSREGQAVAEALVRNGLSDRESRRDLASMLLWGATLPTTAAALALPSLGLSLGLLAGYPLLWTRVRNYRLRQGDEARDASLYATATVLGKIANAAGVAKYASRLARGE